MNSARVYEAGTMALSFYTYLITGFHVTAITQDWFFSVFAFLLAHFAFVWPIFGIGVHTIWEFVLYLPIAYVLGGNAAIILFEHVIRVPPFIAWAIFDAKAAGYNKPGEGVRDYYMYIITAAVWSLITLIAPPVIWELIPGWPRAVILWVFWALWPLGTWFMIRSHFIWDEINPNTGYSERTLNSRSMPFTFITWWGLTQIGWAVLFGIFFLINSPFWEFYQVLISWAGSMLLSLLGLFLIKYYGFSTGTTTTT